LRSPATTIAAVHGVTFGGDSSWLWSVPYYCGQMRVSVSPSCAWTGFPDSAGFRVLKRDWATRVRICCSQAAASTRQSAAKIGLVSQWSESEALRVARGRASAGKIDRQTAIAASDSSSQFPTRMKQEIDIF